MAVTADQQRVKTLLTETIILLCKNGLHFKNEFTVEGLLGITIDKNDVFLINIKETIQLNNQIANSAMEEFSLKKPILRKRRYHSHTSSHHSKNDSEISEAEISTRNTSFSDLNSSNHLSHSFKFVENISESRATEIPANFPIPVVFPGDVSLDSGRIADTADKDGGTIHSEFLKCPNSRGCFQTRENSGIASPELQGFERNNGSLLGNIDASFTKEQSEGSSNANNETGRNNETGCNNETGRNNETGCNTQNECDSNFCAFPLKVKEEVEDVEGTNQCQVPVTPKSFNNQNNSKKHSRQSSRSSIDYSLVDSSIAAYSSLDPNAFQPYHNAEQTDQQVELLPGSGVYISMRAYIHLNKETWVRGSKLVRRVVREVFPDEHILARSSCLGRRLSGCHVGLDHHKVDTIKAFVQQRMPHVSHTEIVAAINECCRDIRAKLRKSYFRSANNSAIKPV